MDIIAILKKRIIKHYPDITQKELHWRLSYARKLLAGIEKAPEQEAFKGLIFLLIGIVMLLIQGNYKMNLIKMQ